MRSTIIELMASKATAGDPAREAWSMVFQLAMANRGRLIEGLEELDLTFMQAHALRLLQPGEERTMGKLAETIKCDPSNITGIVDRLEARGLVERRSAVGDRRVKALALTPAGVALRERVFAVFGEPPAPIRGLSKADQIALRDILRRAVVD
jgi:DNA-binding MarR family transcriptional regulator